MWTQNPSRNPHSSSHRHTKTTRTPRNQPSNRPAGHIAGLLRPSTPTAQQRMSMKPTSQHEDGQPHHEPPHPAPGPASASPLTLTSPLGQTPEPASPSQPAPRETPQLGPPHTTAPEEQHEPGPGERYYPVMTHPFRVRRAPVQSTFDAPHPALNAGAQEASPIPLPPAPHETKSQVRDPSCLGVGLRPSRPRLPSPASTLRHSCRSRNPADPSRASRGPPRCALFPS